MKRSECSWAFLNYRLVGWWPVMAIFSAMIGWPLCFVFGFLWPVELGFAYLTVLSFFFTIAVGALFWVLLHHAVDAAWSVLVRRIWEYLACLLVPIFVLSLPLVVLGRYIWPWRGPHFYPLLSPGSHWTLLGFSLFVLASFAWGLRRISEQEDDHPGGGTKMMRRVAISGIPCYAVGFSLISILAWMSLQRGWISAIWPISLFAGAALSSLALSVCIVVWLQSAFAGKITPSHFHLLGKLLFALTVFWAYVALSQYLIIWYGNLPREMAFFQARAHGFARAGGWVLGVGHFLIPFLLLLPRASKVRPRFLAAVAAWMVLMQLVELCWILLPPSHGSLLLGGFALLFSFAAIGGTLALIYLKWLGDSPLWPVSDHRLAECLSLYDE